MNMNMTMIQSQKNPDLSAFLFFLSLLFYSILRSSKKHSKKEKHLVAFHFPVFASRLVAS